jgi:CheY-like chemotaxis protein
MGEDYSAIRSQENVNHDVTIIAVTGHVAEKDKDQCSQAGFNDVLQKPLSADGFKKTIIKWLYPD